MRGCAVFWWIVGRAVNFYQHKARRIVGLLDHIKARDAGFLHAVARILDTRRFKGFDVFRFGVAKHMHNIYGLISSI